MGSREYKVGLVGTFDVENYGDLLFPLIAREELADRLGQLELVCFSYRAKAAAEWPYPVISVTELPRLAPSLDGLLIGGGFLVRFDKTVAPGYAPPTAEIHHPTGFWLTPALICLQHGVPLLWNAPGVHHEDIPSWAAPLLELAFSQSSYVAVRDEPSRTALERFTGANSIAVVPDTVFGLTRWLPERPTFEFNRLKDASGLTGPYILIQCVRGLDGCYRFLKRHADRLRGYRLLALPIGPVNGDDDALPEADLPGLVRLPVWPHPLLLAELIRQAAAVIGPSYHLAITALAAGVPVFTPADLRAGKFTALAEFDGIYPLPTEPDQDAEGFVSRLGKLRSRRRSPAQSAASPCTGIASPRSFAAAPPIPRSQLAGSGNRCRGSSRATPGGATPRWTQQAASRSSAAWWHWLGRRSPRGTAGLRSFSSRLRGRSLPPCASSDGASGGRTRRPGKYMLDLTAIARTTLQSEPYAWAEISGLFSPKGATALAESYPRDHFKTVSGHDGEKQFLYEARSLIGMGATAATYGNELSKAWLELADDLVSPEYRTAMSLLVGCDLTVAPVEVNVFHYGPGSSLGPHLDLPAKLVTHVLYFNRTWKPADGGCLSILRSKNPDDVAASILPLAGSSSVVVRSDCSWHAVQPVAETARKSRRSATATFYRTGAVSTMWPPGETTPLHRYDPKVLDAGGGNAQPR